MRLVSSLTLVLLAAATSSCGSAPCRVPDGCLRVKDAFLCQCDEWRTVSVESVPIKFVVLSVDYGVLGNDTRIVYGYSSGANMLPASSDLGSRFRALVRAPDGTEAVAARGPLDADLTSLVAVTDLTTAYFLAGGDENGGMAYGRSASFDVPSRARDAISLWINPTLAVETNFIGEKKVRWGWTAVGDCFFPFGCLGPMVRTLSVEEIDGTIPAWDVYLRPLVASLTPDERAAILKYDAFLDPPGRDPATFATDPRFQLLGPASLTPAGGSYPTTSWTPCSGAVSDADFAPLAQTEVGMPWSTEKVVLQHGVLSNESTCRPQMPGLAMGTTTPGCELASLVYVDRAFGTLLFAPVSASASCTNQ